MDFVQRSFFGHIRIHVSITPFKFKNFDVVFLNLEINWARLMVLFLKEEADRIIIVKKTRR